MSDLPAGLPQPLWKLAEALQDEEATARLVADRPGQGGRQAAVLALIADPGVGGDNPDIVLIERATTLRKHAGQIAFPGGSQDPTDPTLTFTALREATEEVGVDPGTVEVLGQLPPAHVLVSGFDVTTIVGWWRTPHPLAAVDRQEVGAVHRVDIGRLTDPANRAVAAHPLGFRGPAFLIDHLYIWGLTAGLLDGVLTLAGWQRDWDHHREVPIPDRFLTGRARDLDSRDPSAH
ncbi:NUDIX hydrolase [Granulicoccus phenolivorans]|uniref:NUDIX hydrolase n=1 Tax=Granulicoccus phenolivorans TaxID=266854 RepID=UPI00041CA3B9|nr:CoA pyrophosphatase [Granulicoccus phenolivorans]